MVVSLLEDRLDEIRLAGVFFVFQGEEWFARLGSILANAT
jgi:hypothetical protein